MDFMAPYKWAAPMVDQYVSDDPAFAALSARLIYDHMLGRLGSDMTVRLTDSADETEDKVVMSTEVWIEVQELPSESGPLLVDAQYELQDVDHKFFDVSDEWGFSHLHIWWFSKPYATVDLPGYKRVYADTLSEGDAEGEDDAAKETSYVPPGQIEKRDFVLKDLDKAKVPLRLAVGLEDIVYVYSNDYSYGLRTVSSWLVPKVTVTL